MKHDHHSNHEPIDLAALKNLQERNAECAPKRLPEVAEAVEILNHRVDELGRITIHLEERLTAVLRPSNGNGAAMLGDFDRSAPLACEIAELTIQVARATNRISDILDRLAI